MEGSIVAVVNTSLVEIHCPECNTVDTSPEESLRLGSNGGRQSLVVASGRIGGSCVVDLGKSLVDLVGWEGACRKASVEVEVNTWANLVEP